MAKDFCEVCGLQDQQSDNAGHERVRVTCARCGTFEWEPRAPKPTPVAVDRQVKLSAFFRELNAVGVVPLLQAGLIQQVERRARPRLRDRALRALTAIIQRSDTILSARFKFLTPFGLRLSHTVQIKKSCVSSWGFWTATNSLKSRA